MTSALLISTVLLWVVVVALLAVVVALVRQIGVLHERVFPVGALVTPGGPRVGEAAPPVTMTDVRGRPVRVGGVDERGRHTLLFFMSPTCPVCKTLLPVVERVAASARPAARLVLASDGDPTEHRAFVEGHVPADTPYVLSAELGVAYQVAKLPYAVLIDDAGILRGKGLVNTREHLESLFEAARLGVASMQEYLHQRVEREAS
jgi:methylamine dehydrogenase accessory protein MauD